MNDLPHTWTACRLGDVVDYGVTRKCEPEDIPDDAWVLELEDIEKGTSRLLDRQSFAQRQSKSTKNGFDAGDVLYGKLRPYLNKVLIADQPGYCTTEIVPLKTGAHLDARYLFYWLKHPEFLSYVEAESHGLNMPRLGTNTGKAAPFVLAPRGEQQRIADKLDAVLARVNACRDHLDRIPAILKRFRQSVLADAMSGQLTVDWRGHSVKVETSLGNIAKWGSGGTPSRAAPHHFGGRIPWVKTGELRENRIFGTEETLTEEGMKNSSAKIFPKEAVLVAMYGATVGRVAILGIEATTNQACAAAVCDQRQVMPMYLFYLLQSEKQKLIGKAQGGAQPNISQGLIKAHRVQLPSIPEQNEIVLRIESLFAFADRLEARYTSARAQVENLTPALVAKAFRGELVPQDPNDEPAGELLERIAAERSAAGAPPRRRQSTAGRRPPRAPKENAAMTKSRQDEDVQGKPYLAEHLRLLGGSATAEVLFKASELPVADFYKQLAWEVAQGHVRDGKTVLELADAA